MAEAGQEDRNRAVKVALVGVSGAGKSTILRNIADRLPEASVRVGELAGGKVYRTEFPWPAPLADGSRMMVELYALSGYPGYNAVSELLMTGCDGLVFVADAVGERAEQARKALQAMVFNAQRKDLDLAALPIAMQYHRTDLQPGFQAEQMDQWLGIAPGSVMRFATSSQDGTDPGAAVAWVLTELARRNGQGAPAINGHPAGGKGQPAPNGRVAATDGA